MKRFLGIAFGFSAFTLFGAADEVFGNFDLPNLNGGEYGAACQRWREVSYPTSGVIAVAAKGGAAVMTSRAIAAQYPGQLSLEAGSGALSLRVSLRKLIDTLNAQYSAAEIMRGSPGYPGMNVSDIVVMIVCLTNNTMVLGRGSNKTGEAGAVPQMDEIEVFDSLKDRKSLSLIVDDYDIAAPILVWPSEK